MAFAALTIDIQAKLANLEAGLKGAESQLASFGAKADTIGKSIAASFAGLGAGLIAGAVFTKLRDAVGYLSAIDDAAEETGISVKALSQLLTDLAPSGVGIERLTEISTLFARALENAADKTSAQADFFKKLGVSVFNAEGNLRSVDEVLRDTAKAQDKYADGANKSTLFISGLGRAGASVIPVLNDLAKASGQGAEDLTEASRQAEIFEKRLKALDANIERINASAWTPLITGINAVAEAFRRADKDGLSFFERLQSIPGPGTSQEGNAQFLAGRLARARETLSKAEKGSSIFGVNQVAVEDARQKVASLERQLLASLGRIEAVDGALPGVTDSKPAAPRAATEDERKAKKPTAPRDFEDRAARTRELVANAIGSSDIVKAGEYADALRELDRLYFDLGLDAKVYDAAVKALTKSTTVAGDDGAAKLNKALDEQTDRFLDLIDPLRRYRKELEQVAEQEQLYRESGGERGLSPFQAEVARGTLQAKFEPAEIEDQVKELDDTARQLGLTFSSAFEDAVLSAKKFSDVLQGLAQDVARIFLRKTVTEPLIELLLGKESKGGLLSDVLGSLFGGARANGGPVGAGTAYLVGERGPELFVPKMAGAIVPNSRIGGGAGAVSVVQYINVDSRSDRASIIDAMARAKSAAQAEILDSMARGGTFARA